MENIHEFEDPALDAIEFKEAFKVLDDSGATWAIRKLSAIRMKLMENTEIYSQELNRINQWLEKANNKLEKDENYFVGLLTDYAYRVRVKDNRKTITLPHGVIKSRVSAPKVKVDDAEVFLGWAKATEANELIRVREEPAVSTFKELFDIVGDKVVLRATGEVVQGVTVVPEATSITIESE